MADVQTLPPPQYPSLTPGRQEVEYVVLAEADGTAQTGLQDYLRLFWRRKWLFLLPAVCILPWIGLFVATQPARYSATTTVLIEKPVRYGQAFKIPAKVVLRKSRQASQQANGKRMLQGR